MKFLLNLVILICANLLLSLISENKLMAQPITQWERKFGLEPSIERYKFSESFGGSDSAWINLTKRTRVFNQFNQPVVFEQMKWDSINWEEEMRWIYEYEGKNLSRLNNYSWSDNEWKETGRSEFKYDDVGREISNTNFNKNDNDEWFVSNMTLTSYDEFGRLLEIINYKNQGFMPDTTKQIHTYDSAGNLIELLTQKFRNGEFENQNITEFRYENSKLIYEEYKFWYGTVIYYDYKDSIIYDEEGRRSSKIHFKYYDGEYNYDYRYIWTYDEQDRIIEEIYQNWEAIDWADPWKMTITYDENGNLVERLKKQLRNGIWLNKEFSTLSYDSENQLTEFAYYIWAIEDWQRNIRYIYEHAELGVEDLRYDAKLFNFPNPFTNETTISFTLDNAADCKIEIFSLTGEMIKYDIVKRLTPGKQYYKFYSGNLPSGIYLYKIDTGKKQYLNTFIIHK